MTRMTFREWLEAYARTAPVTLVIVLACVGAWLVTAFQSRTLMDTYVESDLAHAWTLWGPLVSTGGYSRIVTSAFMHLDLGHITVNTVMLFFVGREVERTLGGALYALTYLVGILGAAGAVLWMNYDTPTAGASGALFALMVLLVGVYRSRGADLRAPLVLVGANIMYSFITSEVSLWGHLGGAFAGLLMLPFITHRNPALRWGGVLGCGLLALVTIVVASRGAFGV